MFCDPLVLLRILAGSSGKALLYARLHLKRLEATQRRILADASLDLMHRSRPKVDPEAVWALGLGSIDLGDGVLWLLTSGRGEGAQSTGSIFHRSRSISVDPS